MNETNPLLEPDETTPPRGEAPVLARLSLPLQLVCDMVCGAFTRRDVVARIGAATPAHLSVLRALLEHVGAWHNRVFPSQKRLAEMTGLCHSSVERAVAFFKRAGAILVLPDFLRRSADAYPVNGYDLSPLLSLIGGILRPLAIAGFPANDAAFFSLANRQNCGSEGSVVVVDTDIKTTTNHTPSEPHPCGTEERVANANDPSERSPEEEEQIVYAATALTGFGVAGNLAYDLAAERGAARTMQVVQQARQSKSGVGAGWLVAALRDGWEFAKRGESGKYGNYNAPFVANSLAPDAPKTPQSRAEAVPKPVVAPVSAPDTLEALTPDRYNALSQEAEAQIRAENPLFGRVGAPRIPRPAVRDRMRKLLIGKQSEADERAQLDALLAEDDCCTYSCTSH